LFLRMGLLALALSAVVIWGLMAVLLRPVKELDIAARAMANGDYSSRVMCDTKDEFGSLATQFNAMAEKIEENVEELRMEGSRQQRFLDNMTHEMRTPLTSIIGYAELLQKVDYAENQEVFQKGLHYIHTEGKRILNLNKTLLDLTFYRNNEPEVMEASMLLVAKEAIESLKAKAEEKGVTLRVLGNDFTMRMDRDMIRSLIMNLVDNGIKAVEPSGMVEVILEEDVHAYHLLVKDNGKGMSEEDLERIKEPFYRVDKSRSRQDGGVGLGLALCEHIVLRHNGDLIYRSKLGAGTVAEAVFVKE